MSLADSLGKHCNLEQFSFHVIACITIGRALQFLMALQFGGHHSFWRCDDNMHCACIIPYS